MGTEFEDNLASLWVVFKVSFWVGFASSSVDFYSLLYISMLTFDEHPGIFKRMYLIPQITSHTHFHLALSYPLLELYLVGS